MDPELKSVLELCVIHVELLGSLPPPRVLMWHYQQCLLRVFRVGEFGDDGENDYTDEELAAIVVLKKGHHYRVRMGKAREILEDAISKSGGYIIDIYSFRTIDTLLNTSKQMILVRFPPIE